MTEPKYDEDIVNLGYLKKVISDTEENIEDTYKNVSRHYASKPNTPYYKGDTWIDGNIVYTCINSREIGLYIDSDWTTESGAKQEAERKNKTYLTQPSNYSAGDMWILQSDNDHKAGKKGEILISSAGRKEYNENDWTNMLGYGTIRSINEVTNNISDALKRINSTKEEGKVTIFYSDTIPENAETDDLWYVTESVDTYIKENIYKYNSNTWELIEDKLAIVAFSEANESRLVDDGIIQSFYTNTMPEEGMHVGDIWTDTTIQKLYRYNGTNWIAVYDTNISEIRKNIESVTERVTTIETDLGEIDLKVQENTTTITTIEGNVTNITNTQAQAEGKNIHIEDSAEEPFVDISLHGESTQNGTPTPDSPIEIENIEGKNIWNKSEISEKTQTVNTTVGELNVKDVPIPFTFSSYLISNALTNTNVRVSFIDSNNSNIGAVKFGNTITSTNKRSSITINEIPEGTVKIRFGIRLQDGGHTEKTQLEAGTVATLYVPYHSLELKVTNGLEETDENYQEQVATFPLGEEKLMEGSYLADDGIHHRRKQYTFTGNETFVKSLENDNYIRFYSPIFADALNNGDYITIDKFICTHFEQVADYNSSKNCIALNNKRFYITISKAVVTDVSTFKAYLAEQYANGTPVIVEYELAEEEVVPFTAEQQEAWNNIRALMTYKNVTNISSDAYAKITYMRDNGLDVYETKQNAEKNYTETTKKLAEQKITVDGIVSEVSETKSNISTMNNNLTELNETVASTKLKVDEYEIKFEEKTKTINEELKENSETIKSMSYTFNTDELSIAKSDDPVNAKINNSGMRVYSYNELKAIFNDKGTGIQKLIVVGSAQLGNLQIVKATDENGEECTDFHHLVSNIQELTDLEVG